MDTQGSERKIIDVKELVSSLITTDNNTSKRSNLELNLHHRTQLENTNPKKLKKKKVAKKKTLSRKQYADLGLFHLPTKALKYTDLLPLHELWKGYMSKHLPLQRGGIPPSVEDSTYDGFSKILVKSDFHGAIVTVVRSRCPSLVDVNGIVAMDTKNTFKVLGQDNKLRTIPKMDSVFQIILNNLEFTIFAQNAEILTDYEVSLTQISQKPGWIEFEPNEIWKCILDCIQNATKNLTILDISIADIVAIGVTNQRETTVLWHKVTGTPLYNAIAWNDTRTDTIVNKILTKIHNKKNYLKSVCGLPLSNCFSALKIMWIMENVPVVKEAMRSNECHFGTLDSWVLWNLTGGVEGGIHVTYVTNASRTMLMNLETLQWDQNLCSFFRIPPNILPKIKSCSEIYGFVYDGPLQGVPIASCLGEQPASLLGQMCIQTSQATCTYNDSCFLLINTGQEIIDSDNGLLTTIAFKLGPKAKPFYALEGAVSNAGHGVSWLKENMFLNTDVVNKPTSLASQSYFGDSAVLSSYNSGSTIFDSTNSNNKTDVVFVPAFSGLYSPYWKNDSRGVMLGLNNQTSAHQVTLAAYEAICFQTRDLLESLAKDLPSWKRLIKLTVGGEFSESPFLLQLLADLCGITIERPQTTSPSCLGAMLASGVTMKLLSLDSSRLLFSPPLDVFHPTMCSSQRDLKYRRWKYAIMKCLRYDGNFREVSFEDKDPEMVVRNSIPGGVFLFSSFALFLATKFFHRT